VTEQTASETKSNTPLLLIIGIAVLATVIPYVMYYTGMGIPQSTTNHGILVSEPVVMTDFSFRDAAGDPWVLADQEPKFRLMIPVMGDCDEVCRETLYTTRQVRTLLGTDRDQFQRVFVQLGEANDGSFQRYLAQEHPDLQYLQGDEAEWREALAQRPELSPALSGHEIYLLHRYGALGLAYNQQHTGNQLLDDVEFLIKTSN
jgi:cytochrome oxidase Cu insertion factor (SCO1/SenC/PrrC family)